MASGKSSGAVCLKTTTAYERTLDFANVSKERAEKAWGRPRSQSSAEDVVAMTAPGGLMVIHGTQDGLFTNEGVREAFDKIGKVYAKAGVPDRFEGVTYDGPHEFNAAMQDRAFAWLDRWLRA